jgi:hypothetical protein
MMSGTNDIGKIEQCETDGPQSALERHLIEEYLQNKGYSPEDLTKLPRDIAKQLMREACRYASLKLAEVESRAQFREEIRGPS